MKSGGNYAIGMETKNRQNGLRNNNNNNNNDKLKK
jgi:hypothetical protein